MSLERGLRTIGRNAHHCKPLPANNLSDPSNATVTFRAYSNVLVDGSSLHFRCSCFSSVASRNFTLAGLQKFSTASYFLTELERLELIMTDHDGLTFISISIHTQNAEGCFALLY